MPPAVAAPGEPWIAYQWLTENGTDGIFLARPDGSDAHQLVPELPGSQWHPEWAPDGTRLAFIQVNEDDTRELWVVNADGSGARRLAACTTPCNNTVLPDWSAADPEAIYVSRDANATGGNPPSTFMLSRYDLATETMDDVLVFEDGDAAEEWRISPDRTMAVLTRSSLSGDGATAVFVIDLETREARRLTPFDWSDSPDWLPDGRIVFATPGLRLFNEGDAGPANLSVVEADGSGLRRLTQFTEGNTGATQPKVAPDGSGIAFTKVGPDRWTRILSIVDADGTNMRPLTTTELKGTHPDVRPVP